MEDRCIDADYMHGKTVCKDFEIKNVDEYWDFHFKSNILPLAVFEIVCKFITEILKNIFQSLNYLGKQQFKKLN